MALDTMGHCTGVAYATEHLCSATRAAESYRSVSYTSDLRTRVSVHGGGGESLHYFG